MILGKQTRTTRVVLLNGLPFSTVCSSHAPPAIVAKMKAYTGQAIPTSQMTGIEELESTLKFQGSIAAIRLALGKGFTELLDIIITDIGLIGDNGMQYAHTYIYAASIKSITPDTDDEGGEAVEVKLMVKSYEFKFDGVTVDEVDGRTGKLMIGGNVIIPAVI